MTFTKMKRKYSPGEATLGRFLLLEFSGKVSVSGYLLLSALLWSALGNADGAFVQKPTDTTVMANDSTILYCSSNYTSTEITWYHYNGKSNDVYVRGKITDPYKGRIEIQKNLTFFNLLILRPVPGDAGRYECREHPLETGASAELIILDSLPSCVASMDLDEVIGSTQCDQAIDPDKPLLSCSVSYRGHIAPEMEWRIAERSSEPMNKECEISPTRVVCNTTLEANLISCGTVFICHITKAKQYKCSVKINKAIYTFSDNSVRNVRMLDEAHCSANKSAELPCSYKWLKDNNTEALGETIRPNKTGTYKCVALCNIRNDTCSFIANEFHVFKADEQRNDVSNGSFVGIVIGVIVLVIALIAVVVIVLLVIKHRRARERGQGSVDGASSNNWPAEALELLPNSDAQPVTSVDLGNCDITNFSAVGQFLYEGLNGIVYGPGVHNGITCAFQESLFPDEIETIYRNGQQWQKLRSKNLIKYYDVIKSPRSVYIAMEYTMGGTVREMVRKYTNGLSMKEIKDWSMQIAQGMEYLHKEAIVSGHGRLSTDQIFILEPSNNPQKTLKINCLNLRDAQRHNNSSIQNFSTFLSPEECDGKDSSEKSDVWSFGIVIWEMLTRNVPYANTPKSRMIRDICEGATLLVIPDSIPENEVLVGILKECRTTDPLQRKRFSEILQRLKNWHS